MIFCMKQIIPFKKELLFKTKVSEITSISLEHTLTLKNDEYISGEFHITGDYKMTEGSINREKFDFQLPFDIALDSKYDTSSIIIDIDNFYYEIINNESLQVNIDIYIEGEKQEKLKEDPPKPSKSLPEEKTKEVLSKPTIDSPPEEETRKIDPFKEKIEPAIEVKKPTPAIIEVNEEEINQELNNKTNIITNNDFNIFENIDNSDTYITYYVYIVKEEDTLDKILTKYNVTKEEVSYYNNIEEITPGTKLIIPSPTNE